ncbi:hypothetical protein MMC25_000910 [Agyrium rufum]|nr:hypothetical protein [Agyrium rufum]
MSATECAVHDAVTGDHSSDHDQAGEKKIKSRRPANTAFRQQRLKAWQPILTPKTVLPLLFAVGIIFAPIGGALLYASSKVQELVIDYSDCLTTAPHRSSPTDFGDSPDFTIPSDKYYSYFGSKIGNGQQPTWLWSDSTFDYDGKSTPVQVCSIQFEIPDALDPPVLFYYRLTNFYQNHRRYVKSLDSNQLSGDAVSASTINGGSCDPLRLDPQGRPYYPCGLIANSVFNDTFSQLVGLSVANSSASNFTYPMTNKGIAWGSDAKLYGPTKYAPQDVSPPPNWELRFPNGYTNSNIPNLQEDESFQVWMRTAALPTFDKLAMRNDDTPMNTGRYQVDIQFNFLVSEYGGTKSIVISTRTVMGGRNPFLGIAYIVVGGICLILGTLFTVAHLVKPRKLGDHTYLTWNNADQPTSGSATGISRPGNVTA